MKPLIGIVGRRKKGHMIEGMPEILADIDLDLYLADYSKGILAAGGVPVWLAVEADPADYVGRLDGLVLTGGADVGPDRYGAEPETDLFPPEPVRDDLELALMDLAIERNLPTLGICRGLQIMNVHGGGTLHQHVPAHSRYDIAPETLVDSITFEPDTVLEGVYGATREVNTLHHQTVDAVAADYVVSARASDGVVEGLEHASLPLVSVQWHPEMMTTRDSDPIFRWLIESAVASRA
ncbi:MAG: gamma-glutamyl-gamma-aminobutyrate hydrolase family protein [Actinomycetota bacterium]